jgi:hypothetical protein
MDDKTDKIDKLKRLANPSFELVDLSKEHSDKLDSLVILLGALCDSTDKVIEYKEAQKQGDIKYRKKSTVSSSISLVIASLALYISVAVNGVGDAIVALKGWLL